MPLKVRKQLREAQKNIVSVRKQKDQLINNKRQHAAENERLIRENETLTQELEKREHINKQKSSAQKLNSYYRKTVKKLRDSPHSKQPIDETLQKTLLKKRVRYRHANC